MSETTLVMIKPNAVAKDAIGRIIDRFESAGLWVVGARLERLSAERCREFYAEHDGKPFILTYLSRDEATVLLGAYGLQVLDVQPYPLASQPHDPADTKVTVRLFTPTA